MEVTAFGRLCPMAPQFTTIHKVDQELETIQSHTLNLRPHRPISHSGITHPKTKILASKTILMSYVCMYGYVCMHVYVTCLHVCVFGLHAHMQCVCMAAKPPGPAPCKNLNLDSLIAKANCKPINYCKHYSGLEFQVLRRTRRCSSPM